MKCYSRDSVPTIEDPSKRCCAFFQISTLILLKVSKRTAVEFGGQTPVAKTGKIFAFVLLLCQAHLMTISIATLSTRKLSNQSARSFMICSCSYNNGRLQLSLPLPRACQGRSGVSTKPQSGLPYRPHQSNTRADCAGRQRLSMLSRA